MRKPFVIIHFQPLELYPPVMNLIRFLAATGNISITVYTNRQNQPGLLPFGVNNGRVSIKRMAVLGKNSSSLKRYFQYGRFYTAAFFHLMFTAPEKVLYYEILSSYPVYLYKRFFKRKLQVLVHYHEYTSPAEYKTGMKLTRYFHTKEQWLYPRVDWLSHTNEERLQHFLQDERQVNRKICHIMPNYPGKSWQTEKKGDLEQPFRMVYAGAVSRETMYFENLIDWLLSMSGLFTLDIYSFNISNEDAKWLQELQLPYVRLLAGVNYDELPAVLRKYSIGLVLYNGHIPNYVLNAPNKLFEYFACGLDVWVPDEMSGCQPCYTRDTYPKILPVNFRQMGSFNWQQAVQRNGMGYKPSSWYYELVYPEIEAAILG